MAVKTYVVYCGGKMSSSGYTEPKMGNVSNITNGGGSGWNNSGSTNDTDADAFIFEKFDNGTLKLHVYKSKCSPKMKCTYGGGYSAGYIISNNEKIWQKIINKGQNDEIRVMADYNSFANPSLDNDKRIKKFNGVNTVEFSFLNDSNGDIPSATTDGMFSGCSYLTSCEVPCQMRNISYATFSGCTKLSSYTTNPDFIEEIGNDAFKGCTSLPTFTIGRYTSKIGSGVCSGCTAATSITWSNISVSGTNRLTNIPNSAFEGCTSLSKTWFAGASQPSPEIRLPSNILSIGDNAFKGCTSMTSLSASSVTSIGSEACSGCTSLTTAKLDSTATIGASAFTDCTSLTTVTLPNSVANGSIGNEAFMGCSNLTSLTIPNGVTSIGHYAFKDCTSLLTLTMPNSVTAIDGGAFSGCTSLTSVTIPNNLEIICATTFSDCDSLTTITIPDSVKIINLRAFDGCDSSTSIMVGTGVTSIYMGAFRDCTSLNEIVFFGTNPPSLMGGYHFTNTNNCPIYVPDGSEDAYKAKSGWSSWTSRIHPMSDRPQNN